MTSRSALTLSFCFTLCIVYSQDRRTGTIDYQKEDQGYRVKVEIPPPRTIPGARTAFDEHLIEFGDGTHSFDEAPLHNFPPGNHTIRTSIINNYDDGKPPKIPPRMIEVDPAQTDAGSQFKTMLPDEEPLEFIVFQDPIPMEEVVCIITYRNTTSGIVSGKIDLYYNERVYGNDHFEFVNARLHHGEMEVPEDLLTDSFRPENSSYRLGNKSPGSDDFIHDNTIASLHGWEYVLPDEQMFDKLALQNDFDSRKEWQFSNLDPGEERNMYITLVASSAMLKDTNATVRLAATIESDDGRIRNLKVTHKQIVTSHDPNRMTVRPGKIRFARRGGDPIEYYVKFQNHGEGPARQISIECALSDDIDLRTLRILDMYPPCPMCPEREVTYGCLDTMHREDGITFTFKNIYLPGREQNLTKKDSTKGFIRFEVRPGEKLRKVPFNARSSIIFDKNEPIRTNAAKLKFRTDVRTGLIAGIHNNRPEGADPSNLGYFAGMVISPYRPYRFYYQAEIIPIYANYTITDVGTGTTLYDLRQLQLDIVPLQIRKNLASFVGIGSGLHLSTLVYSQQTENGVKADPQWLSKLTPSVFADVNLGSVRSGISGGARYYLTMDDRQHQFWSFYLLIRR